ncbi:MAG: site-specific DNA-methyltransferase [Lactobacillaceae bacterium]|jgi:site-specific DNA-methyltransferase (adenine-specific)|nr:site-specific DNA-methyltransferase [Lactobacillaceae bacterium]
MVKQKAPRNKTIELSPREVSAYAKQAVKLKQKTSINELENKIIFQDSFKALKYIPDNSVDLIVVDPPYNLTKIFGTTKFKECGLDDYKKWFSQWLKQCYRILKQNGTIYICSDWKTSIAIPEIACKYFTLQNRISWEREKGRGAKNNWKNCLEDIWFFTKSNEYTFNLDSVKVQRNVLAPYRDTNGKPKDWVENGDAKLRYTYPSNIWTDISIPFWSMPENTSHPTQKPEKLIAKLILASSNEEDIVFDPFLGSGTTAVTAKKLNRKFLGIEREKEYVALGLKRLEMAEQNKRIQGFEGGIFKIRNSQV